MPEVGGDDRMTFDLHLIPGPRAPGEARRSVADSLDQLDPDTLSRVRLLVSELVTNSVRHARLTHGDRITLSVSQDPGHVRVVVTDPGVGFDSPSTHPRPRRNSGWGLYLVDRLADRWGVASNGDTRVWFEVSC
jgi:anti-sigma regulatory factor (Ser/Thr protein kinase)